MAYDRKDHFYRKAKEEGKASRAVYKLAELQKRFRLIRSGDCVLDLGAAPGGWLQELGPLVGDKGRVIGIDLLPLKINAPKKCTFIRGDLTEEKNQELIAKEAGGKVDVVLSDMSPNLSGVPFADSFRSYELAVLAFEICEKLLMPRGNFVVKYFPGDEYHEYLSLLKKNFSEVTTVIPKATRKSSSERYIVALGFTPKKSETRTV